MTDQEIIDKYYMQSGDRIIRAPTSDEIEISKEFLDGLFRDTITGDWDNRTLYYDYAGFVSFYLPGFDADWHAIYLSCMKIESSEYGCA